MVKVEVLAEALVFDVLWLVVILVDDEFWVEVVGPLKGPVKASLVWVIFIMSQPRCHLPMWPVL